MTPFQKEALTTIQAKPVEAMELARVIDIRTLRSCVRRGWMERKRDEEGYPDIEYHITDAGRAALAAATDWHKGAASHG